MKKVRFVIESKHPRFPNTEEIVEYDSYTPDRFVDDDFNNWVFENIEAYWEEIEDDEE